MLRFLPLPLLVASALLGMVLVPLGSHADETLTDEELERLEAADRHTERAWKAFRSGNYDEVLARVDRIRRYDPEGRVAPLLEGRVRMRRGAYEEALEVVAAAREASPEDRALEGLHYQLLFARGRHAEVLERATASAGAASDNATAHAARGLALEASGQREEALAAYDAVIGAFNRGASPDEDLPWVARAAIRVTRISPRPADDMLGDALRLLGRWIDDHPQDQDAILMYAGVFQADRGPKGQSKASKYYKRLLDENPELPAARVGLARTFLVFYQQDRAMRQLERALETNPNYVPALSLLASIHVSNGDYEEAGKLLDRADAVDRRDPHAQATRAAMHWITGDAAAYRQVEQAVLERNDRSSEFYTTVSELVGERQRRYDVAATFAEKAVKTDPDDGYAYTVLGEALMNLGRTDEARKTFREGVVRSKRYADVRRDNWLDVLEVLDGFETLETERFRIRVHPSEADVMEAYLPPLMEDAWTTLAAKYGYDPEGPVRVDTFHRQDDFSVRSVGTPGLPALGVCFGEVITLLGPTSRPVGSFSWSRTAWHEFAHTITLGLSRGQVPRWLTEGLSVYEEKMRRPHWGREMEAELYARWRNGRLLPMAKINQAFRGPDIMFAYFQGGLIAEHLTRTWGFEVIPQMLREFGKDRTTAQVFRDVLGIELDDYDRRFLEFVEGIVGTYRMVPRWDDASLEAFGRRTQADPDDVEAWARMGWARVQRGQAIDAGAALREARSRDPDHPEVILLEAFLASKSGRTDLARRAYERFLDAGHDDLGARMFLANDALEGGRSAEAIEHLEAAKQCFPTLIGKQSPYLALARLYEGGGEVEKAISEYEAYTRVAGEDYGVRKKLVDWYAAKGDHARVAQLTEEMIEISPFGANPGKPPDLELHRGAAAALAALGRADEALRELEVQVALVGLLDEEERVKAGAVGDHLALGRRYLEMGRPLDALSQAAAALRLSPQDAQARILKGDAEEAAGYR